METLFNGYTLEIPSGAFALSTDSMVLADFVRVAPDARVLDLGSGCGTLGLLLCARCSGISVLGLEIDAASHAAALENIRRNALAGRLNSICADLRAQDAVRAGSFDAAVSNPPYFSGGPASRRAAMRREDACTAQELFAAASRALKWGGKFFLVHRPERLAAPCAAAVREELEPKRLRLIRHRPGAPVSLIALECRKGGKPGLRWEELSLLDARGAPSADYRRIYHLQEESVCPEP